MSQRNKGPNLILMDEGVSGSARPQITSDQLTYFKLLRARSLVKGTWKPGIWSPGRSEFNDQKPDASAPFCKSALCQACLEKKDADIPMELWGGVRADMEETSLC